MGKAGVGPHRVRTRSTQTSALNDKVLSISASDSAGRNLTPADSREFRRELTPFDPKRPMSNQRVARPEGHLYVTIEMIDPPLPW